MRGCSVLIFQLPPNGVCDCLGAGGSGMSFGIIDVVRETDSNRRRPAWENDATSIIKDLATYHVHRTPPSFPSFQQSTREWNFSGILELRSHASIRPKLRSELEFTLASNGTGISASSRHRPVAFKKSGLQSRVGVGSCPVWSGSISRVRTKARSHHLKPSARWRALGFQHPTEFV